MQIYIIPRNRYISVQTQGNSRLNNASIRQKKNLLQPSGKWVWLDRLGPVADPLSPRRIDPP